MDQPSYESGQRALAKEVIGTFGRLLAAPRHERDCPVELHQRHMQQVLGNGPRAGRFGRISDEARAQYNRDVDAMKAKTPACRCNVHQASELLAKLRALAA
ncbi:hypothetical protein [Cupriavidus sp. TMH.W2]|uniref:hypothetical protein n=1 Tax=Cupriavidus sp. TMH.W2 TaxID=3434465 RepID=UPI003D77D177